MVALRNRHIVRVLMVSWLASSCLALASCGSKSLQELVAPPAISLASAAPDAAVSTLPAKTKLTVDGPHFVVILDTSASMKEADGTGTIKIDGAKTIVGDLLGRMTEERVNVSVVTFNGCGTPMLAHPTARGFRAIRDDIIGIDPTGSTPLAQSIMAIEGIVRDNPNRSTIIVISDGDESCGGNPCAEAARLKQDYAAKFAIYTVGYNVDPKTKAVLQCVAKEAGGNYLDARNTFSLESSLHEIVRKDVTASFDSDFDGVPNNLDRCPGTAAGFEVDASGCAITYTFRINFDVGSHAMKPEFEPAVNRLAQHMRSDRRKVRIDGHTDVQGDRAKNIELSNRRARAVVDRLITLGVPSSQMSHQGYGPDKPIGDNGTSVGRYRNRRVEARFAD